ncbi:MAG: GNAT family N-acetyltransferase [Pirellulales bacterium]|nr:GNAT family N-acetyltransferase [Pirellulales bacterium]
MFTILPATPVDVSVLLTLIRELAQYEQLAHTVTATEKDLRAALFGPDPVAAALVARLSPGNSPMTDQTMADSPASPPPDSPLAVATNPDAIVAGFALYYRSFSTFVGRAGIYLEDIYVRPVFRRHGLGKQLFTRVAQIAVTQQAGRMEWAVLNWNQPARAFYESLGAVPMKEWTTMRLSGEELRRVGGSE